MLLLLHLDDLQITSIAVERKVLLVCEESSLWFWMRRIGCWLLAKEVCCPIWGFVWRCCRSRVRGRLVCLLRLSRRKSEHCRINPEPRGSLLWLFVRYAALQLSPEIRIWILTETQVDLDTLAIPDTLHQTYCLVNVVHKEKVSLRKSLLTSPYILTMFTVPPRPAPHRAKRQKTHHHLRQPHLDSKPARTLTPQPRPPRNLSPLRPPTIRPHQQSRPFPRQRCSHSRVHRHRRPWSGYSLRGVGD